jgi:hypothetical protein
MKTERNIKQSQPAKSNKQSEHERMMYYERMINEQEKMIGGEHEQVMREHEKMRREHHKVMLGN